jgi:hypothetical protein
MDQRTYFGAVAAGAGAVVIVFAVLLTGFPSPSGAPAGSTGERTGATVYRNLTIEFNAARSTYSYNTGQLNVPLDTRVVFTITNFDPSPASMMPKPSDAWVTGTMDGSMVVGSGPHAVNVTSLPAAMVSHTFSMSDAWHSVNIPLPAATAAGPSRVTFAIVFTAPGTFNWGCVIMCGSDDMSVPGSMYGTLTVAG